MYPFQLVNFNGNIFQPAACYGDFQTRLNVAALAPLVLIACIFIGAVGYSAWRPCRKRHTLPACAEVGESHLPMLSEATQTSQAALTTSGGLWEVIKGAILLALPTTLWFTYLVLPEVASRIFSSFPCDSFKYDDLHDVSWYLYVPSAPVALPLLVAMACG
jgi:hypothetical protein